MTEENTRKRKFFVLNLIIRLWCIITVIVLWVVSIRLLKRDRTRPFAISWYLMSATVIATILECIWIMNKMPWCQENGCCYCVCWKVVTFVSKWKKGLLYIVMSLPTFWISKDTTDGQIGGSMLLIAGILLIFRSIFSLFFREDSEERKYFLKTNPVHVKMVSHEISTQTEDSEYSAYHHDVESQKK
ncbi:Hypothetical predicted protein [Octopus vulgaris]|uniref:Transmembrane protein n=1 Tax=Octopus vulgaris TaxID=6645 RepID=A0AA36AIN1_OCTVU|nr:Hypothetical predicted protein [Octopus vulgaris]